MKLSESLREKIHTSIGPVISDKGYRIYDMELTGSSHERIFRVFIDHESGITLKDCTEVSRAISDIFDAEDFFPFPYSLEVSSPGVFRELRNDDELRRFLEHRVQLKFKKQENGIGLKDTYENEYGLLRDFTPKALILASDDGKTIRYGREMIQRVKLAPVL